MLKVEETLSQVVTELLPKPEEVASLASLFKVDEELKDEARQLDALTQTLPEVWLFVWLVPFELLDVVLPEQTEFEGEKGGLCAVGAAAGLPLLLPFPGSLGLLDKFGDDIGLVNGALVGVEGDCEALISSACFCCW